MQYKKLVKLIIIGVLLVIPVVFSCAQTVEELKNQINSYGNKITDLENSNKEIQKQLDNLGKQKNSLNNVLKQLDLTKKKLASDILITENKIQKKNLEIKKLNNQIDSKESSISENKEAIILNIKKINEIEQDSLIEEVLANGKISDIWVDVDSMITIRDSIRDNITKLSTIKGELEDNREITSDAKKELVVLKGELADQKKIVDQNVAEKKKLLAQTKNSETGYQKILKTNLAKMKVFEAELQNYESQLKYKLDPATLPGKGVLSWPLDYIYITSPFGQRSTGFHGGVDFRARTPVPVRSMADGVVAGTGDTDLQCSGVSFGRFILIKYNNGLASTYGHLSLIKVKKGDNVSRGQIVGYTGNTGYSTGPHLHLSLYPRDAVNVDNLPSKSCPGHNLTQPIAATNAYLDPMYYLPAL